MGTEAAGEHKRSILEIVRAEMPSRAVLVVVASLAIVVISVLMKSISVVDGGWIDRVVTWVLGN